MSLNQVKRAGKEMKEWNKVEIKIDGNMEEDKILLE